MPFLRLGRFSSSLVLDRALDSRRGESRRRWLTGPAAFYSPWSLWDRLGLLSAIRAHQSPALSAWSDSFSSTPARSSTAADA